MKLDFVDAGVNQEMESTLLEPANVKNTLYSCFKGQLSVGRFIAYSFSYRI